MLWTLTVSPIASSFFFNEASASIRDLHWPSSNKCLDSEALRVAGLRVLLAEGWPALLVVGVVACGNVLGAAAATGVSLYRLLDEARLVLKTCPGARCLAGIIHQPLGASSMQLLWPHRCEPQGASRGYWARKRAPVAGTWLAPLRSK